MVRCTPLKQPSAQPPCAAGRASLLVMAVVGAVLACVLRLRSRGLLRTTTKAPKEP